MKGSMIAWMGFLMMIAICGLLYIILDAPTAAILVETNSTLTNTDNQQALDYARTIWWAFIILMLFAFMFWAFNQTQKEF